MSTIPPETPTDGHISESINDVGRGGTQFSSEDLIRKGINDIPVDHVTDLIHWTIVFIITPSISIFGIIGNTLSLIVLAKHGFTKSSNILLFSLAISDILFMIGINGPPKLMYEWGPGGFPYPETTARILYYLYQLTDSLNWITGPISLCIPILIMIERLIAVFLPLRFPSIVTVRRTVIAIISTVIFSAIQQVYVRTWFKFAYIFDNARNISVGVALKTDIYRSQRLLVKLFASFFNYFFVLIIFVGCGCIAIGFKLKMVARTRLKMTNCVSGRGSGKKEVRHSRTTKMLLCLCMFYTFACAPTVISVIVPKFMVYPIFTDSPNFRSMGVFIYHVYKLAFAINGSSNFVIYCATNKKFRDTLLTLCV